MNYTTARMLYKGAGPGTHWHQNDARLVGFTPATASAPSVNLLVSHIMTSPHRSPYLSFSTSFAIAREYAMVGPKGVASQNMPGFVYVVDFRQLRSGLSLSLLDPLFEIADGNGGLAHFHDGGFELISEIAQTAPVITSFTKAAQRFGPATIPQRLSELQAIIRAVRDAEVLVNGNVPSSAVVDRDSVF